MQLYLKFKAFISNKSNIIKTNRDSCYKYFINQYFYFYKDFEFFDLD